MPKNLKMAKVIAWRFERKEKRFIIKFSDRRRVKVRTIKAMLGMNEGVQRDILAPWGSNGQRL